MLGLDTQIIVPGHGSASYSPREDLQQTRDYLAYLRETMGKASQNLEPFEDAYKALTGPDSRVCRYFAPPIA